MESSNLSMRLGKLNIPNFNESVSMFISKLEHFIQPPPTTKNDWPNTFTLHSP